MTEASIKKAGFKKVYVSEEESGDKSFYYYIYKVGNLDLVSNSQDNLQDGSWIVEILEGEIQFNNILDVKDLITLLERNKL